MSTPPPRTGRMLGFNDNQSCYGVHHHSDGNYGIYVTGKKKGIDSSVLPRRRSSSLNFIQNCDLPPPLKVFNGTNKTPVTTQKPSPPPPCTKISLEVDDDDELPYTRIRFKDEKLNLLKALQLSQTRAREAEKKATLLTHERDRLSDSLLKESFHLFAHRQWLKLLELEVFQLRSERQQKQLPCSVCCPSKSRTQTESSEDKNKEENVDAVGNRLYMALAFCVGIAGVGFAFGCRYLF